MPAAAELASAPGSERSRTVTFIPACARRQAIEQPMIPPPMISTSAAREESSAIASADPRLRVRGFSPPVQFSPSGARGQEDFVDFRFWIDDQRWFQRFK